MLLYFIGTHHYNQHLTPAFRFPFHFTTQRLKTLQQTCAYSDENFSLTLHRMRDTLNSKWFLMKCNTQNFPFTVFIPDMAPFRPKRYKHA